jgi:hypothetical protein
VKSQIELTQEAVAQLGREQPHESAVKNAWRQHAVSDRALAVFQHGEAGRIEQIVHSALKSGKS